MGDLVRYLIIYYPFLWAPLSRRCKRDLKRIHLAHARLNSESIVRYVLTHGFLSSIAEFALWRVLSVSFAKVPSSST